MIPSAEIIERDSEVTFKVDRDALTNYIAETFDADAEFPWKKYPNYIVFRHNENRKWFALITEVQKEKLGLSEEGSLDILNVKCDPIMIGSVRTETGIYPAYHMNKSYWISVALDGSVEDEKIMMLLKMSFDLTSPKVKRYDKQK